MVSCPKCRATLRSPLVCETCGALLRPAVAPTPFETLGLETAFALDPAALRARVLALSRRMHPDYFSTAAPEERELAERNTAELNSAQRVLGDELRRADWLVKHLEGPDENQERSLPAPFLQEVLEWNETIEAARTGEAGPDAWAAVEALGRTLAAERASLMAEAGALLTPLPPSRSPVLAEVRKRLNAVRYVDRALREIAELSLARQASTPR